MCYCVISNKLILRTVQIHFILITEFDIVECNLPTKKDGTPQIKSLLTTNKSNNTNSVAVGCQVNIIYNTIYSFILWGGI
jgi:hypothetical protein